MGTFDELLKMYLHPFVSPVFLGNYSFTEVSRATSASAKGTLDQARTGGGEGGEGGLRPGPAS